MSEIKDNNGNKDGIDRRGFLECMAWVGTGLVWAMQGGILRSQVFGKDDVMQNADFTFVQISDSHIGFGKDRQQGCRRHASGRRSPRSISSPSNRSC